jgi:hypothetical protein
MIKHSHEPDGMRCPRHAYFDDALVVVVHHVIGRRNYVEESVETFGEVADNDGVIQRE